MTFLVVSFLNRFDLSMWLVYVFIHSISVHAAFFTTEDDWLSQISNSCSAFYSCRICKLKILLILINYHFILCAMLLCRSLIGNLLFYIKLVLSDFPVVLVWWIVPTVYIHLYITIFHSWKYKLTLTSLTMVNQRTQEHAVKAWRSHVCICIEIRKAFVRICLVE